MVKQFVVVSQRQCICTYFTVNYGVFGQKQHSYDASASIFSRLSPIRLFRVPVTKKNCNCYRFASIDEIKSVSLKELKTFRNLVPILFRGFEEALT